MYIINKIGGKYIVKKVEMVKIEGEYYFLKDNMNNIIYKRHKNKVLSNKEDAIIVKKERQMILDYKIKSIKNGMWECSCCGSKFNEMNKITVDHIKPISLYKNIRQNKEKWNEIWNEKNFSIKCKRCNKAKADIHYKTNNYLENISRKRNNKSLKFCGYGRSQKVGQWIKTGKRAKKKFSYKEIYSCAIRDSRILNLNKILKDKKVILKTNKY